MGTPKIPITYPAKMGLLIGLVYCVLIYIENRFFSNDTMVFTAVKCLGFLLILAGFFYTANESKKQNGGYITFQEALRVLLVTIAICELLYLVFNFIYVKYIDPEYMNRLKISMKAFLQKSNLSSDEINNRMKPFDGAGTITVWSLIQSYGFAIIVDAVFAVIIASIIKRNPPVTAN